MNIFDNQQLITAILEAIKQHQLDIAKLVKDPVIAKNCGLNPSVPLDIIMGSDIECRVVDEDGDFLGESDLGFFMRSLDDDELLCAPPHKDGDRVELNPKAGTPLELIKRIEKIREKFQTECKEAIHPIGSFRFGRGHFHISFEQENNLWRSCTKRQKPIFKRQTATALFYQSFLNNLLDAQLTAPAAFLHPLKAEKAIDGYSFPYLFECDNTKASSIKFSSSNLYRNGAPKCELRLSTLSPYLPILLLLNTVKDTLKQSHPSITPVPTTDPDKNGRIPRGKDGYMSYFDKTYQSEWLDKKFPTLAGMLYLQMLDDYGHYMKEPYYACRYTPEEKQERLNKCAELEEFFCQKYPPKETSPHLPSKKGQNDRSLTSAQPI